MVKVQNVKRTFEARFWLEEHENGKRVAVLQIDQLEGELNTAEEMAKELLKADIADNVYLNVSRKFKKADIDQEPTTAFIQPKTELEENAKQVQENAQQPQKNMQQAEGRELPSVEELCQRWSLDFSALRQS